MTEQLPTLVGSDKQIAWATDIRNKLIGQLPAMQARADKVNAMTIKPENVEAVAKWMASFAAVTDKLMTETSCRWWIDQVGQDVHTMIMDGAK